MNRSVLKKCFKKPVNIFKRIFENLSSKYSYPMNYAFTKFVHCWIFLSRQACTKTCIYIKSTLILINLVMFLKSMKSRLYLISIRELLNCSNFVRQWSTKIWRFEVWYNNTLKNNTIRCKKLATIASQQKNRK